MIPGAYEITSLTDGRQIEYTVKQVIVRPTERCPHFRAVFVIQAPRQVNDDPRRLYLAGSTGRASLSPFRRATGSTPEDETCI